MAQQQSQDKGAARLGKAVETKSRKDKVTRSLFASWMDSLRASLLDSLRRLVKHPIGSFFTALVIAVALSLPMGLSLLLDNLDRLSGSWQKAAQISLFLNLDVGEPAAQQLRDDVAAMPNVLAAEYISRTQALEEFQQQTGIGQALKDLPENPLPASILVTPKQVDKQVLENLRQQLADLSGVELAQLDQVWVERLSAILTLGQRGVFGLTLLLVSALLLVIGNTIRLAIENRRTEIEVIRLVGGTDGYIRRPFLYMGAFYGLFGGFMAWVLLAYGLNWLNGAVVRLSGLYASNFSLSGISLENGLLLVTGALLLGWIGAWLAVARHLSELSPR